MLWHLPFCLLPHSLLLLHPRLCAFWHWLSLAWEVLSLCTNVTITSASDGWFFCLSVYRNNQGIDVSSMGFPPFLLSLSYFPPSPRIIRQAAYFPCSSASCLSLLGGQSLSLTVDSLSRRSCSAHHRHSVFICWLAEGMREWKHNCTDV